MKKKNIALFGIAATLLLSACSSNSSAIDTENLFDAIDDLSTETKVETVEVDGLYSMEIPDFMTSTTVLNDDASLQYNNLYKEKYVIVIDEDKQEFIDAFELIDGYDESISVVDNYANIQIESMTEAGSIQDKSDVIKRPINGMNARQIAIDANVPGISEAISYWLGYVEGDKTMYTIMTWTLESRKDDYEAEANKIIRSLKEM